MYRDFTGEFISISRIWYEHFSNGYVKPVKTDLLVNR